MIWITEDKYLLIPLTRGFSPNWFWDFLKRHIEIVHEPYINIDHQCELCAESFSEITTYLCIYVIVEAIDRFFVTT